MFKKIKNKIEGKAASVAAKVRTIAAEKKAEGYVDTGVKILIAVVIGALLLAGLYALFNDTVLPSVTDRIVDLFSYAG